MSDGTLRAAVVALSLAGAGIAAYLLEARLTGSAIACTNAGCETVAHSRYAAVGGVPVAGLGLAAYLALAATGLSGSEAARAAGLALALAGVAVAGFLLYAQLALIGATCQWCLASDAVLAALLPLTALRLRSLPATRSAESRLWRRRTPRSVSRDPTSPER